MIKRKGAFNFIRVKRIGKFKFCNINHKYIYDITEELIALICVVMTKAINTLPQCCVGNLFLYS